MRHHWISAVLIALLIAGCGSTPRSNYYMLSAEAGGTPGMSGPSIGVGPITVPDYLKRKEMVLNRDANRLELAEYDRWAETLDAGILRVTALNLASLLETQQVQRFPWRRKAVPDFGISIAVVEFSVKGTSALLVAEWRVSSPKDGTVLSQRISSLETSARSSEPADVAAAYSQLLARLAEQIAADIKKAP